MDTGLIAEYKALAVAIIKIAVEDATQLPYGHKYRAEAERFFESEWFEGLASFININADSVKEVISKKQIDLLRKRKALGGLINVL